MKKIKYLISLGLALCGGLSQPVLLAQMNANLKKGLVAYYPFSGNAEDESGNANHGRMRGGVELTKDRFGNDCSAMSFNGRDGFISVPHSLSLSSPQNGLTVAAWFKLEEGARFSDLQWVSVCCKSDLSIENDQSPQYRFQSTKVTVSINTEFTEELKHEVAYNQWYFYTLTYNREQVRLYLNSRLLWAYDYDKKLVPNDRPLDIGRDVPGVTEFFAGLMDDIHIYNRPLSSSEIRLLYEDESQKYPTVNPCGLADPQPPVVQTKPEPVKKRIDFQETVRVKSKFIKVYLYDHEDEDGDIISLRFDDEWVLEKHKLKGRKKNLKKNKHVDLELTPGQDHYLVSKAWNLGSIPPNTLTVEIHDGLSPKPLIATINSQIGRSGAIRIRYDP
ncbi:MAG: LamG domain-containing protein [Bacteroidota bacterium]